MLKGTESIVLFCFVQTVGDRVGKNEKTKVTARLQKKGGGAPVREAAISEDERRAMMAHYYKKQVRAGICMCMWMHLRVNAQVAVVCCVPLC